MSALALQAHPEPLPSYQPSGQEIPLFEAAYRHGLPVLLKGPTGCGKTRFVEHMAARLRRPLVTVSCHDDLSATDLLGRHLIGQDGTYWVDGPLAHAVRTGSICYLDEVVEARKDTTVILHALTDDRRMLPIERTGECLIAPPEFMLVVSYNPGYQQLLKGLKPSTRQRFVSLSFDFPEARREACIVETEAGIDAATARRLVSLAKALRASAEYDLEEAPGTRLLVSAGRLMAAGIAPREACRVGMLECLSDDPGVISALGDIVDAVFEA
ncbi:CbbQ/NirQ/NorQ/GpvN family protein [Thiomonas sp.]|jgi:nitric oxide reductase NorQ protein|uniref:CbbQ/NirQ/NorQ/GpvN family protein n=1 Tax=Thiomonas sp. TaxID=2047785 RepID=UPI0026225B6A|nr:CbbQ/NirQ/NorQ/GpvN family protein [Thiomonas sp.]